MGAVAQYSGGSSSRALAISGAPAEAQPSMGQMLEELRGIVGRLNGLAMDQVRMKLPIEQRWLEDLRAFHGRYDSDTERKLKDAKKSRAFVKITRKKTNAWEARLSQILLPTDDENWGIQPTPVPELTEKAKQRAEMAMKLAAQATEMLQQGEAGAPMPPQAQQQVDALAGAAQAAAEDAKRLEADAEEAKRACAGMQTVMKDQLIECQYPAAVRDVIRDVCRLGTGVMKGPLVGDRARGVWKKDEASGFHAYTRESDPTPVYRWVDPWCYFPDMNASRPEECEFDFERHLWTKKDLRKLVKESGFDPDAVRRVIMGDRAGPMTEPGLHYLMELRGITGEGDSITGRYVGWEYHGPLECDEVCTILRAQGKHEEADEFALRNDPLEELRVIIHFCNGEVLKIAPEYLLESGESLYSSMAFEPGEASIFGYGIPNIMSDSQRAMNGAWRMAMDNAGLSVGPQIVIERNNVEPANGSWEIEPRKIWYRKASSGNTTAGNRPFEAFDIPNNISEIITIVREAREHADDETAMPTISEGEQGDQNPNQTATAASLLASSANVVFRRVVKAFDDGVTAPNMRRLYDWNMQFHKREDIKGDAKVDARGTSVLLVREIQSQLLMALASTWTQHPTIAPMLKNYQLIRKTLQSMMIPPEDVLCTEDEYEKNLAAIQSQPQQDPATIQAQARIQAAQIQADSSLKDNETDLKLAQLRHETAMMTLAENRNMNIDQIQAMLAGKKIEVDSKERSMAAEVAVEQMMQERAAARGEEPQGSGGSFSA